MFFCISRKYWSTNSQVLRHIANRCFSSEPSFQVVFTWGLGTDGQLGHKKIEFKTGALGKYYIQEVPRRLVKSRRFRRIAVGNTSTIAVTHDGQLFGWGVNFIGGNHSSLEPVPIEVPGGKRIVDISAGSTHAAAIDEDGQIYTWGEGGSWWRGGGQLGHGVRASEPTPRMVEWFRSYGAKAKQVSCGGKHTLVLTEELEVLSFGVGEFGHLGTGSTEDSLVPAPLVSLESEDVIQVAAGFDHSLVLTSDGRVFSWGRNNTGQLGIKNSSLDMYSLEEHPTLLKQLPAIKQVAAGNGRSAVITADGNLYLWGSRFSIAPSMLGIKHFGGQKLKQVAIGGDGNSSVVAVVTESGELWTNGDSKSHMLGKPKATGKQIEFAKVDILNSDVDSLVCGFGHHMAAFVNVKE